MKRKIISIFLSVIVSISVFCFGSCGKKEKHHNIDEYILSYDIGNKESFNILQLTDLQLERDKDRKKHYDFITQTVKLSNADFIVVTGDLVSSISIKVLKELLYLINGFNLPWTVAFGNHDEGNKYFYKYFTNTLNNYGKNCLFKCVKNDDVFGNSNFAINLTKNNEIFEQLIIMDSNNYRIYDGEEGYDYIRESQIQWYENLVDYTTQNNNGKTVQSLLYFHIPLPEWNEAYSAYLHGSDDAILIKGSRDSYGGPPEYNSGFFDVILEKGSTKSINVGHDHTNNYIIRYKGIDLSYGVKSTTTSFYDENILGGRVLTINSDHLLTYTDILHKYN